MENFLFDVEKIEKDLKLVQKKLNTPLLFAQIASESEQQYKFVKLQRQKEKLNTCLLFHKLVDLGKKMPELTKNSLMTKPTIKFFIGNIQKYLRINRLYELSLLPTPHTCFHGEHALMYAYEGNKGAVICVNGMQYVTNDVFAAKDDHKDDCSSYGDAKDLLGKYIVSPFTVGLHNFVLRSIPIRIPPEMDWKDIQSAVDVFLRKNVPIRDGFIQWKEPEAYKIFGLVRPNWWKKDNDLS